MYIFIYKKRIKHKDVIKIKNIKPLKTLNFTRQEIMINLIERDSSRRKQAYKYELSRLALKCVIANRTIGEQERFRAAIKLNSLPRNSSKTRLRNRCVFTGRGRAVYRFCKLSRIELRRLAGGGKLPGISKSSW